MSLYPTLEDMGADKIVQAQTQAFNEAIATASRGGNAPPPYNSAIVYPSLGSYLGLDLSPETIRANMPEFADGALVLSPNGTAPSGNGNVVAPLSGNSNLSARAEVSHNIREFILCKDAKGKVGMRVQAKDNGIFVCIVVKNSPSALAGIRFGDQILSLNGTIVSGYSVDKIHAMLKKSDKNNISVVIRDRPFERTITLMKDSRGDLGFQFKNGMITAIVKDSSAAKNGVLINHNLLEVNGQTVVALKDKEITKIIQDSQENFVKITIVPSFLYEHLTKKLSTSFLRGIMDHSIPEF